MDFKMTINGKQMEFKDAAEAAAYVKAMSNEYVTTTGSNTFQLHPTKDLKEFQRIARRIRSYANKLLEQLSLEWYRLQNEQHSNARFSENHSSLSIVCCDCGSTFTFTSSELAFYDSKNLSMPKRCKPCCEKNNLRHISRTGAPYRNSLITNMHSHTECVGTGERIWKSEARRALQAPHETIAFDPTNELLCSWIRLKIEDIIKTLEVEYISAECQRKETISYDLAIYYTALNEKAANVYIQKYIEHSH